MTTVQIVIHSDRLHASKIPEYKTADSAGVDLCANVDWPVFIQPGARSLIRTGISLAIPRGFEGQVRPRSGLALNHGITVLNSPGTIDADYRGEIGVVLINHGSLTFVVNHGDRIAQLVIAPVEQASFTVVDELSDTERGAGGFGSTGVK